MPRLLPKWSSIPKPPMPVWLTNHENKAKGYSYVNIVIQVYQLYSFWFDIYDFGHYFLYGLIYCAFVLVPMALAFFLLIAVHKRQMKRVGIWWVCEIGSILLHLDLFIVGVHGISGKIILNLVLHTGLRLFGLRIIYDYMVSMNLDVGGSTGINKVSVGKEGDMVEVPLDDPWSADTSKF